MVVVIIGMLVCIGLALFVLALVALPAHRKGDTVFVTRTERAEADARPAPAEGREQLADDGTEATTPHETATVSGTDTPAAEAAPGEPVSRRSLGRRSRSRV